MSNRLVTVKEIVGYLRLSLCSIYMMVGRREILHYRFGRIIRFRGEEVEERIKSRLHYGQTILHDEGNFPTFIS